MSLSSNLTLRRNYYVRGFPKVRTFKLKPLIVFKFDQIKRAFIMSLSRCMSFHRESF